MVPQHIVARASQLRAEQAQWEGLRQQAAAKLLELADRRHAAAAAGDDPGFYYDNEQEQLRSQISAALFHMQEIGRELTEIRAALEAEAREAEVQAFDPERERMELVHRDDARNEQLLKEAADKADAQRQEEQVKADALEKAQRTDVEFLATINEEWEYVQAQIAEEYEYIQAEIAEEMEYVVEEIGKEYEYIEQQIREEIVYSAGQARDALAEAVHEIKTWIENPIDQKEGKEFLDARKQALEDFVADEVFKSAPADIKEMQLRDKILEQWRAEEETFGGRNDSLDVRDVVKKGLADLQETLLKAVEAQREIETAVNKDVEGVREARNATAERLEKAGYAPAVLEEKQALLEAAAKKHEQELREKAEAKCQAVWDKAQDQMRVIAAETRAEAERQDAEARKQAERKMEDAFRSL